MTNETTNQNNGVTEENVIAQPVQPAEPVTDIPEADRPAPDGAEKQELQARIEELEAELLKEQIKVKLLVAGILPEKLEDGAAMAYGLCLAGKSPETAADEIAAAYPHLKAVRTELPQFSAESAGSKDGFSAIRRIFASR